MADGRLQRFVSGLGLGYLHTVLVLVVGLWLTPFLLRQLGTHDYGLWLLASQVLVYLALMDLGVVALVPREVAFAVGQGGQAGEVVTRTMTVVAWQTPLVAAAAAAAVWLLPADWEPMRRPFAVVAAGVVLAFPLRVFTALLQGLQDLAFLGVVQVAAWIAGTAATIALAVAGAGLYALAAGWVVSQLLPALLAWHRVSASFPEALPRPGRVSWQETWRSLGRGSWISVAQVAQVLLSGTDLVVAGRLLGPEAIVPYACTSKLISLLANQPQLFMQMALPALSELRGSAARARLFDVSRSMTQVMLLASGAIVAVVLVVNGPFVSWWVGESRFGGLTLTALLLAGMLVRHVNTTIVYTLFCFGYERRLALTSIVEGVVGVALAWLLVPRLGLQGAAAGMLLSTLAVSLPANVIALAREQGASPWAFGASIAPWFSRFAVVTAGAAGLVLTVQPAGLGAALPLATAVAAAYLAVMMPVLRTPPLGPMLSARLQPWLPRMPRLVRRLAMESSEAPPRSDTREGSASLGQYLLARLRRGLESLS
jgi:O-antigen/teichoic acid export membrane protein